jgi:hypothetical protein
MTRRAALFLAAVVAVLGVGAAAGAWIAGSSTSASPARAVVRVH